jgi:hypothetical protein
MAIYSCTTIRSLDGHIRGYKMKKLLMVILLGLTLFPDMVSARAKLQGFVEQGNTTLTITGGIGTIVKKVQGSFPGATVAFYDAVTGVIVANCYADNAGTAKPCSFTSSADGSFFVYLDNGRYDIQFSGTGITTPFTIGDNIVFDPVSVTPVLNVTAGNITTLNSTTVNATTGNFTAVHATTATVGAAGSVISNFNFNATATVADGGTITHGMGATPTMVLCTPSVAAEMCSVTAIGGVNFTVALKKHDGTVGTVQTVYWLALK